MRNLFIIIMLFCVFITGCGNNTEKFDVQAISVSEVKTIIDNMKDNSNTVIIDVRTMEEYDIKHIDKAINIPLAEIDSINIDKNKKIIVYCQSGNRSRQAADRLIELGYMNVFDMGGINLWIYDFVSG